MQVRVAPVWYLCRMFTTPCFRHSTRADLTYGRTIESVGEVYAENAKVRIRLAIAWAYLLTRLLEYARQASCGHDAHASYSYSSRLGRAALEERRRFILIPTARVTSRLT